MKIDSCLEPSGRYLVPLLFFLRTEQRRESSEVAKAEKVQTANASDEANLQRINRSNDEYTKLPTLSLPNESRINLLDLRTLEHNLPLIGRSHLLLQRVAFEVNGREVGVRLLCENGDGGEEVVVGLCTRRARSARKGRAGGDDETHPELFEVDEVGELLCRRRVNLVVPDVEGCEFGLVGGDAGERRAEDGSAAKAHVVLEAFDLCQSVVREVQLVELSERLQSLDLGQSVTCEKRS